MSFPPYAEYKDSGVAWLGAVPGHWAVARFKTVLRERDARSEDGSEELLSVSAYTGVTPKSESTGDGEFLSRAETLEGYKICKHNDLVMNIMLAWNRGLGVTKYDGIVSPAYCVFELGPDLHPDFCNYALRADEYTGYFKAHSAGVIDSRLRLYPDKFGALFCAFPSLAEQEAIAGFLDREVAKIDGLVAEQERLIALLKEKRQAVISHAVTKGLNPSAPLKDSGIEWLGQIPAHWEVVRIKHVVSKIEQGWSPQCDATPVDGPEQWGILKVGCVNGDRFNPAENKALPDELEPVPELALRAGDVLISRANTRELVGSAALVEQDYDHLLLCDKLYRLRLQPSATPEFLTLFLRSSMVRGQIEVAASGASSSMLNIGQSVILEMAFPLPPLAEQGEIASWISISRERIGDLIDQAQSAITLLAERRAALICAAVTGKIDVRAANTSGTVPAKLETA